MKIIFNYPINDWKLQIYQELQKRYEIIIPDNFLLKKPFSNVTSNFNFESLQNCVMKNLDAEFIFSFFGDIRQLLRWRKLHINMPIVDFRENTLNRPFVGPRTAFVNLWYDERFAQFFLEQFNRENLIFAGMAANPEIFHPLQSEKKYDISFIGQPYGERGYYIKKLHFFAKNQRIIAYFPRAHGSQFILTYERINEIYNQSKINIAFAPKEQPGRIINLRSYEICMSGNFQLVQYTPCLEEFFEFGTEIVGWTNTKDLIKKIRYYLNNSDERERIAKNGYERAIKNHTWTHRFTQLITFIEDKKKRNISKTFAENFFNLSIDINRIPADLVNKYPPHLIKLEKLGYNLKKDLKRKSSIKLHDDTFVFSYKPNLKSFGFIEVKKKILLVIYTLPKAHPIVQEDWETLVRIRTLIQNFDFTPPLIGVVTNEDQCLCFNFEKNQWLRKIPSKALLTSRFKLFNWLVCISLTLGLKFLKKMKDPMRKFFIKFRNKMRFLLRFKDWKKLTFLKLDWTTIWVLLFGI